MRYFVRVVDAGSFSEAARQLGKSKALLSKYVAELENELGVRLLNRTTRTLSLTEVGRVYLDRSRLVLDDIDEIENTVRETSHAPMGELRVTAPQTYGEVTIVPMVREFIEAFPSISVDLRLEDRFVDIVDEGFDVAIRIADLSDSSLISRRLGGIRMVTYASQCYLEKHPRPLRPEELREHRCIIDTNMQNPRSWQYRVNGQRISVAVNGPLKVNSALAVRDLVLADAGIGLSPSFVVEAHLADGRLIPLLEPYEAYELTIHALYAHRRHLSSKVRCFVDFLGQRFDNARLHTESAA
ncbi:MAG: LysR family transcriptional regulator [Gammaproteobacteria bacterium]|nr:LysR family transcriptional regulator [Gammaproteobacteria bacterium]